MLEDMNEAEIAWVAGLFEGEGCIILHAGHEKGVRLVLGMTDADVIARLQSYIPSATGIHLRHPAQAHHKTRYDWRLDNGPDVAAVLRALLPWFGERRAAKAREAIALIESRVGIGGFERAKTHCKRGHEFTPENTKIDTRGSRVCRTCSRDACRRWRERRAAAHSQERL